MWTDENGEQREGSQADYDAWQQGRCASGDHAWLFMAVQSVNLARRSITLNTVPQHCEACGKGEP